MSDEVPEIYLSLYKNLEQEWKSKRRNLNKCGELLTQLKVALTSLNFLPIDDIEATNRQLLIARNVLEIGAEWSIATKDVASFERYMSLLKVYYYDYASALPASAYQYQLLGLNLLHLLSQNRVAEFHTELELLPIGQCQQDVYLRVPLSLEQYLMEGSYNKIFLARHNVPAESYGFFVDQLLGTVRREIGACLEAACDKISLQDATRMLNLDSGRATLELVEAAPDLDWRLEPDGCFHFSAKRDKRRAEAAEQLPSAEFAALKIDYARELERIV
ncbi:26S proteasome non-ATPase regulatory subunit 8 [Trichogramma pretiosum]|uniref:26S proteasome non-ATPase regulatory subunit 8 n=1 Tax=Trichogramma pretiosum TaxID=7493 RepID=UPI0006C962FA|nr:26S proteasome non-ATPase regulatory subunit 8 [Trichogramma pretiosum]